MRHFLIVIALALVAAGCVSVRTTRTPVGDLARFRRFDFYPAHDFDHDQFARSPAGQAMRDRVVHALEQRGLTRSDAQPDFWVACYLVVEEDETAPYASPMGPLYLAAPGTVQYLRGTVVVDFIDPATRNVFWRGTARQLVSHPENPDPRKIASAVDKLMRHHPLEVEARPARGVASARK
jgi:hypothetical protein